MLYYGTVRSAILIAALLSFAILSALLAQESPAGVGAELNTLSDAEIALVKGRATPSDQFTALISQIKSVLKTVQHEISSKKLPVLKNAQLNLQTSIKYSTKLTVLFFIQVGESTSNETAQTIKVTLSPLKTKSRPGHHTTYLGRSSRHL
jgi:hypothetical protein